METKLLLDYLDSRAGDFIRLSDDIWEYAELSMTEERSCARYVDFLRREGFRVEEQAAEIPTAFRASFGQGRPVIGLLAEYDALSGLSQKPGLTKQEPLLPGGNGHGCGHNLLGAGALAAAVAIKELLCRGILSGTIVLYGCPGEEGCAGKTFMARDGMFRELDAALTWHPGDVNEITTGSNAACLQMEYTFTGRAAHAASCPEQGRSALDAAELMNVGIQFLREHTSRTDSIHYSFLDAGGQSPNVVQPKARVLYMVRSDTVTNAKKLLKRVNDVARGAALMTDTAVSIAQVDGTSNTLSNTVLEKLLQRSFAQIPLPDYTGEEWKLAQQLFDTYESPQLPGCATEFDPAVRHLVEEKSRKGKLPINDFLIPYVPSERMSQGSTDVGDVSWLSPTAQFTAVTWPSGTPAHSWQAVSVGTNGIAHKGMLLAGKVLALSVAALMEEPSLLEQAREEFARTAQAGYDCPLGPEVQPKPTI